MSVRVRYAPSPTGDPHVGNIRSALFNWLFARRMGGVFIVRIEDTDQARLVPGALERILEALRWLGLDWDEGPEVGGPYGPYIQSQRLDLYHAETRRLMERGAVYECYCSPEELDAMRKEQQARGRAPMYDRRCRRLTDADRRARAASGRKPVVRFAIPLDEEKTIIHDVIRGDMEFQNSVLDDFVLLKSDGFPTYHLANVVDDHAMEITHVMRADEWIPSTPRHVLLYQAFDWAPPNFAHLPIILGPDRSKLSKRHGATGALEYRDQGYLPDAMVNFLALLGWSLDDKTDIIDRDTLKRSFSLERVSKSPAIFDKQKLDWMNGVYIRAQSPEVLARQLAPYLERGLSPEARAHIGLDYLSKIVPLVQERLKTLADAPDLTAFFFAKRVQHDPKLLVQKGMDQAATERALTAAYARVEPVSDGEWTAQALERVLRPLADELGLKTGQLFGVVRVATTGRTAAPPLFETMATLGRERCLLRVRDALLALKGR